MKLTLLLLLAFSPTVSGWSLFGGFWRALSWDSFRYYGGQCTCTSPRIPLEDKLAMVARDNDYNDDGVVTFEDVDYDITQHYDKNRDRRFSEGECVERFICAYGDTEQVAQFVCANILGGEASVAIADINVPPFSTTGIPLTQFLAINRERYERFFNNRCVNRELTLEEKLTRNAANNDYNSDGLVTTEDIVYDLSQFYDADGNGEVTKAEFVIRWACNYADRGDYARYLWDLFFQGAASVPNRSPLFSGPPYDTGVPVEEFKADNRQNYANFRTRDASSYIQPQP